MAVLKRDIVKYVRDKAKARYRKDDKCHICESTEKLDFHHFQALTDLLERWLKKNKIKINCAEDIMRVREDFIAQHETELYDEAVTLCKEHHLKLHSIYGKKPALSTGPKQKRWVERQRIKNGLV